MAAKKPPSDPPTDETPKPPKPARARKKDPFALEPGAPHRPSMLTRELTDAIMADVKAGVPLQVAALSHGIKKNTLDTWKRWGRKKSRRPKLARFRAFMREYAKAKAINHGMLVKCIRRAAPFEWQAARYLLMVQNRERYGDKQFVKHEGNLGLTLEQLADPDELDDALDLNKPLPPSTTH